jgi:hypothetical protein
MKYRWRPSKSIIVASKVVLVVNPKLQNAISVQHNMLGLVSPNVELSTSPSLILNRSPAIYLLQEGPVYIGIADG